MKTWAGKFLGWLWLATLFLFGAFAPQLASAASEPSITTQPVSQSLLAGTNATFSVVATGQGTLYYQWSLNRTNLADNAHINGSTNSTLTISNLVVSDAGNYQAVVSNSHGSVTSSNATLTLLLPPLIVTQPTNVSVILSSNASFAAQVSGTTPLSYQWQKDGVNLTNNANVSGANSDALNLSGVLTNAAGFYQLVASNNFGVVTSTVATLTVQLPIVSIDNATLIEGDTGTNAMIFTVHLSTPIGVAASVWYWTYSSLATSGEDFDDVAGTLVFPPGETNQTITVWVHGDRKYETDETFPVYLSGPSNAKIEYYQAIGTILNDDPLPEISVQSTAWPEGNIRSSNRIFSVTLSRPSQLPVNVAYQTEDQSAIAGSDYISTNGTISFNSTTNVDVPILVRGDLEVEPDETLSLSLTNPINGVISPNQGVMTILNDDSASGFVNHFGISTPVQQPVSRFPTAVTVTALDANNQPVTNFSGSVLLMAGFSNQPPIHMDFEESDFSIWSALGGGAACSFTPFDTAGTGNPSFAFCLRPIKTYDGIQTTTYLPGGKRLFFSANVAYVADSWFDYTYYTSTRLALNQTSVLTNLTGYVYVGSPIRTSLFAPFDGATYDGYRSISLTFATSLQLSLLVIGYSIYADDVVVSPASLPGTRTVAFTNGIWTGPVIFRDAVTNVLLFADDDERHRGSSEPFNVQQSLDVAVGLGYSPAVPRVGTFSLNMTVTNLGPCAATAVVVTNFLPTGLTFVSATTANGSCTNSGTNVLWLVGALASNQVANATVVVSATDTNTFSPSAIVSVAEPDFNLLNNTTTTTFTPAVPSLSTVNMSASEQVGGSVMTFPVTLSAPFDHEVSVQFSTMWSPFAGTFSGDIIPTNGVLIFPPGTTLQNVSVVIVDDLIYEGTEYFTFELTFPTNAVVGDGKYYGLSWSATLYDNEPPPTLAISDCTIVEGDAGTTNAVFTVTLVGATALNTTVNFATASGTASAGSDFIATNGTLTFAPGTNSLQIVVPVKGNTVNEGDETFFVNLSNPVNATLADAQGLGTILNDDAVPNRLDHFEWVWEISSPQIKNRFIPAALVARDAFGQVIYDFQGTVTLSAMASNGSTNLGITPITISNFQNGAWADYLLFTNTGNQVVLRADDGNEHIGFSNPFDVLAFYPTTVRLPTGATESDGPPIVTGVVDCIVPNNVDAWFTLTVNNPGLLSVPGTVMLPAGQTNVPFDMQFSDDALLNGTRTVSVTATPTTTGYATNTASMQVYDNEFAVLGVNLPASVAEKSSPLAGTVTLSAPPDTNIVITLTSSDTTELTVPASVILPAGQTSVGFTAYAVDDTLLDGTQSATVTAHVQNWQDGTATVAVIDNETNKFTVSYWFQGPFTEGIGTISNALRLTVGGVLLSNLTVNLTSSDTTELIVPATVTIGAGSNNTLFNITIVNDTETDGTQPVTVTASLPDFTSGSLTFNVADNDLHHFTFSTFASVQTSGVPFSVTVTAKDVNNLTLTGYTNIPVFSANGSDGLLPLTSTGFSGTGILRGTFSGTIAVSAHMPQTVTLRASDDAGHDSFSSPFELQYPAWAGTPQIVQVQVLGPDVVLSFPTVASAQYFLEMATNLPPTWHTVGSEVIGNDSILTLTNTDGGTDKMRLFRLLVQPAP